MKIFRPLFLFLTISWLAITAAADAASQQALLHKALRPTESQNWNPMGSLGADGMSTDRMKSTETFIIPRNALAAASVFPLAEPDEMLGRSNNSNRDFFIMANY